MRDRIRTLELIKNVEFDGILWNYNRILFVTGYNNPVRRFEPGENKRANWVRFKRDFQLFLDISEETNDEKKKKLLLFYGGSALQDVFYNLPEVSYEVRDNPGVVIQLSEYETALNRLDEYFAPKLNEYYERHKFRNIRQEEDESFDNFYLKIEKQAKNCEYHIEEINKEIVVQIIEGCKSMKLRSKLLDKVRGLDEVLQIGRSFEDVEHRSRSFGSRGGPYSSQEVCRVDEKRNRTSNFNNMKCYRCGGNGHMAADRSCPAWGKYCMNCRGKNHFKSVCKGGQKRYLENSEQPPPKRVRAIVEDNENLDYTFHVSNGKPETVRIEIGGVKTVVMIDSGSDKTIISKGTYDYLVNNDARAWNVRNGSEKKFMGYASDKPLEIVKQFTSNLTAGRVQTEETIYVCSNGQTDLLGKL